MKETEDGWHNKYHRIKRNWGKECDSFGRLGIRDVDSLITMYPKYYLTYEDPKDVNEIEIGQRVSIFVRINSEVHIQYAKRMKELLHAQRKIIQERSCLSGTICHI